MPSHYKLPFLRGKIYNITLFKHELQTAPDLILERKEASNISSKNGPAFYLETRMYESRTQVNHRTSLNRRNHIRVWRSHSNLNLQGTVPERRELHRERAPEICIGGPLSLWQNIQFCICVVRHHETRQRITTSERTTNKEL